MPTNKDPKITFLDWVPFLNWFILYLYIKKKDEVCYLTSARTEQSVEEKTGAVCFRSTWRRWLRWLTATVVLLLQHFLFFFLHTCKPLVDRPARWRNYFGGRASAGVSWQNYLTWRQTIIFWIYESPVFHIPGLLSHMTQCVSLHRAVGVWRSQRVHLVSSETISVPLENHEPALVCVSPSQRWVHPAVFTC